jgi:hypothetical protein
MELVVECVHQLRWFLATKTVARLVMIVTTSLPRCSKPTQFRNQTCSSTLIVRYFSQGCQGSPRGIQVCGLSSTPTGNLGDNEDSDGDVNGPYTQFGCCIEQNRSEVGLVLCRSTGRRENSALGKIQDCPRSCPKIVHLRRRSIRTRSCSQKSAFTFF